MAFEKHGEVKVTAVVGDVVQIPCVECGKLVKVGERCLCKEKD